MERSWGCAKTSRRQATKPFYCQDRMVFCNPETTRSSICNMPLLLFRQIPQTQIWKESFPAVETSNFGSQSQALRPMLMALEAAEHRAFKACQVAEEVPCLVIWCCFWVRKQGALIFHRQGGTKLPWRGSQFFELCRKSRTPAAVAEEAFGGGGYFGEKL